MSAVKNAQIANFSMSIDIARPPNAVWEALTNRIGAWWPGEFYGGGKEGGRNFVLEAQPGGRMYETWDDGGGVLWGQVVGVKPNEQLQVLGSVFPNWGGPTQWFGTWDLTKRDAGTRLEFSEADVGTVSDASIREKDKGLDVSLAGLTGPPRRPQTTGLGGLAIHSLRRRTSRVIASPQGEASPLAPRNDRVELRMA